LSHIHALAWASKNCQGTTLLLEDDFHFNLTREATEEYLQQTDTALKSRWDVIQLGQYVHMFQKLNLTIESRDKLFRLWHSTTGSGYLMHPDYIRDLVLKFHEALQLRIHKEKFDVWDYQDQLQIEMQKNDCWLGFDQALGSQVSGLSTISHTIIENSWRCSEDFRYWYDANNTRSHLLQKFPVYQRKLGVILKDSDYVNQVIHHFHRKFFRPYSLSFIILPKTVENVHMDLLQRKDELKKYDFLFYVSENLWLLNSLPDNYDIFSKEGLFAVKNDDVEEAILSVVYEPYFQGGSRDLFLQSCDVLSDSKTTWNEHLKENVPRIILSSSEFFQFF